jgi:hypothetical protein
MTEAPIYVSFTTLPSRIGRIRDTIDSLLAQTVVPETIFVSIPDRSLREDCGYVLPEWLRSKSVPRVEVVRCARDYGPGTKLLGCLPHISRPACLIIVDDDLKYSPFVIERLYRAQMSEPRSSFSFYVYRFGPLMIGQGADGFSFYTPNLTGIEEFAIVALQSPALFVTDDLWISAFLNNKGIRIKSLRPFLSPNEVVYAHAYVPPNQLQNLGGELQRDAAMYAGTRYLVKAGLLRFRLRCEYWLRRFIGPLLRSVRAFLNFNQTR